MVLDKRAAERRRFARLLGTTDGRGSGLPVGYGVDGERDVPAAGSTAEDGTDGPTVDRRSDGRRDSEADDARTDDRRAP